MNPAIRIAVLPVFRKSVSVALMLSATALAGCASMTKPQLVAAIEAEKVEIPADQAGEQQRRGQ